MGDTGREITTQYNVYATARIKPLRSRLILENGKEVKTHAALTQKHVQLKAQFNKKFKLKAQFNKKSHSSIE